MSSWQRVELLAAESRVGDRDAHRSDLVEEVTRLFGQFRNPLLRYLLSMGLAVPDGEEIIQEVFLALFLHLKNGKPRDHLRGWVFRVGHNLALKHRERSSRNPLQAADGEAGHIRCGLPNPEEQAVSSQRQRRMTLVIAALPEQDRACLSLRAEGFRYREIAQILDMSLGAVALSLERSLGKLSRADETGEGVR